MSTEESTIDDKKTYPDFKGFTLGILSSIFYTIILQIVILGNVGLFLCKVAQSNVLPDNILLEPFGEYVRNVEEIEVNINVIKQYGFFGLGWWAKPTTVLSQKAIFNEKETLDSYFHGIVGYLLKCKYSGQTGLYFANVINSVIATNNYFINKIYGFINSVFSEWIILLFYPFVFVLLLIFHFFVSFFSTILYLVTNIKELFRLKDNKTNEWENEANINYFFVGRWLGWVRFFILLLLSGITISIVTLFTFIYSIFSPLFLNYKVKGSDKKQGFLNFMLDSFLYKSQLLTILLTLILLVQTSNNLGPAYLLGAIVAVFIGIFMNFYQETTPTTNTFTSSLVSSVAAKVKKGPSLSEKQMLNKTDDENMTGGSSKNKK